MLSQTERFCFGSFIDGQEVKSEDRAVLEVRNPYNNELVGKICCATKEDVEQAIAVSQRVFQETMKKMPRCRQSGYTSCLWKPGCRRGH